MKVSIVTVCLNSRRSIADTIESVINQSYKNIEYIVIDGGSTDGTLDIINKYNSRIHKIISKPDKGIYDAMNKGIRLTTGDVIGILNSDDIYFDNLIVEKVIKHLSKSHSDLSYGDIAYVDKDNLKKIKKYWRTGQYNYRSFENGWIPPHPTVFVKRWVYEKHGVFDLNLPLVADHDLLCRIMYKHKVKSCYIPEILIKMRMGGASDRNKIKESLAVSKIIQRNGINVYPFFYAIKYLWLNSYIRALITDKDFRNTIRLLQR